MILNDIISTLIFKLMKTKNIILNIDKIRSMSLFVIFLLYNIAINAQTSKLSGIVSDAVGILPGVSVSVKGTTNGTILMLTVCIR